MIDPRLTQCSVCKLMQPRKGGKYLDGAKHQRFKCAVCLAIKLPCPPPPLKK